MTTPRPDPRLGTDLGAYRIEAVIGRGGMGVVYLATDRHLGRKVALKLLPDDLAGDVAFRQRFERESRLAASIDYRNIIPIYEAGEADGAVFLAMRYVEGIDLAGRLAEGPLDPQVAVAILLQVAGALDAAHAHGLVHRDVKPANVLLANEPGAPNHVYLTDFGLTKERASQSGLTQSGSFLGSLAYMAPEQIDGHEVDGRADQYALAAAAFECLTGRVPFVRDADIAVAMAHLKDPPPSAVALRPELPARVDAVLARALAKDPEARYADCGSFVLDLAATLGVGDAAVAAPTRSGPTSRRPLAIAAAFGIVLLVVAGAVAQALRGSAPAPSATPDGSVADVASSAPSASTNAEPTSSAFPTADEADLLAMLPADLAATCARGGGVADAIEAGFTGRVSLLVGVAGNPTRVEVTPPPPTVSLTCRPSEGAARVHLLRYKIIGSVGPVLTNATDYLGAYAMRYGIVDGDCLKDPKARQNWSNERHGSGALVCLQTAPFDGSPWISWSFAESHVLAFATRDDRDFAALYDWFQRLRTFLP